MPRLDLIGVLTFFEMVGAGAWAHVALPLVVSPAVEMFPAQPAQPKETRWSAC